jgi:DNA-binding PadR family transcriptional regulator
MAPTTSDLLSCPTMTDAADLTVADAVVLAILSERPMHGYEVNQTLEEREVADWAGVSRPQVYYSLKKLARLGYTKPARDGVGRTGAGRSAGRTLGPERRVVQVSIAGARALATGPTNGHHHRS